VLVFKLKFYYPNLTFGQVQQIVLMILKFFGSFFLSRWCSWMAVFARFQIVSSKFIIR